MRKQKYNFRTSQELKKNWVKLKGISSWNKLIRNELSNLKLFEEA